MFSGLSYLIQDYSCFHVSKFSLSPTLSMVREPFLREKLKLDVVLVELQVVP